MGTVIFRISQYLVQLYFRLQFCIKVYGAKNVPTQGKLLFASNHISGYDPPLIGSVIPRSVYFMGKKELFDNPLLGGLIRLYHCIPVDRADLSYSTIKKVNQLLQQEEALLLFPEGTRSKTGQILPMKTGVGMIAARNRANIVPVYVEGLYNVRGSFLFKRPEVAIRFGRVIEIEPFLQNKKTGKEVYLSIVKRVGDSIQQLAS